MCLSCVAGTFTVACRQASNASSTAIACQRSAVRRVAHAAEHIGHCGGHVEVCAAGDVAIEYTHRGLAPPRLPPGRQGAQERGSAVTHYVGISGGGAASVRL